MSTYMKRTIQTIIVLKEGKTIVELTSGHLISTALGLQSALILKGGHQVFFFGGGADR